MYNYTITRLSYLPVFLLLFAGGVCAGGLGGIVIGLLEKEVVGLLGGTFFGFVVGLASGIAGLIYTFVFNLLAPVTGGLKVRIDANTLPLDSTAQPTPNPEPPASDGL
ncbi:hypothetical protein SPFL3102_02056 [Sporomusaceae bacterium FL31]|nr:hypothetical protein SPFL3101_03690 [Sporomusaceae bacterium FL31]GCE34245.1 hypothetical protein SPFL3102_02056 [Sporomusaceae bacterium]